MIDPDKFTTLISKYEDGINAVDVYDKFLNGDGNEIPGGEVEFEVRFISKADINNRRKTVTPGVKYNEYKRVIDEFVKDDIEPNVTYDDFFTYISTPSPINRNETNNVNFRRTTDADGTTWIIKHKLYHLDILEYNIRVGISTEQYIDEDLFSTDDNGVVTYYEDGDSEGVELDFMFRREKRRLAAAFDSGNQIHMTEIISSGISSYEIEIEHGKQELTIEDLRTLNEEIEDVFRVLYGSYNLYKESERLLMVKFVNDLHNKPISNDISRSIMVESRNIKFGDLKMGGIVGGNIQYALTDKADGQRYLMIVHDTGIWLAFPEFQYNLVMRVDWPNVEPNTKETLYGFICDGEDVPLENRLDVNVTSKTWFLAFDTLAVKSDISIQNKKDLNTRLEQLKSLRSINDIVDIDILKVEIKNFNYVDSVDKFFESSSLIVKINKEGRRYKTDGMVITPMNDVYNPHRGKIPLNNRVLTSYSDICKWKPDITIDLAVGQDKLKTVKYEDNVAVYVDFIGNELVHFDPSNYSDDDIQNILENTVVEFRWDNDKLVPIRIRYDKKYPNPEHIAKDNWDHIHNAITEDTIAGRNTKLMRKYHNRIKRNLFLTLPENSTLLDIASGSGGDVEKWKRFSKVVAVEPNLDYIEDRVINGKTIRGLKTRIQRAGMTDRVRIVNTIGQDTERITKEVHDFLGGKADNCSIMLGMSFLWESEESFNALVSTITNNTKKSLIYMTIDGDAIKQMWEPCFSNVKAPKRLEIGERTFDKKEVDYIEYNPGDPKGPILVNIGDIVTDQHEYLVFLEDLMRCLYTNSIYRADQEGFLNKSEKLLSMLYSYGTFDMNPPDIKYKKKNIVDAIKSYPTFDNKTNTEDITEVVEDITGDIVEDIVEVVEDIPGVIPEVVEFIPEVVEVIPEVVEDIPKVVEDIPKVVEDIPEVVEDIPKVVEDIPEVVEDIPKVVEDIPEVVENDLSQKNELLNSYGKALSMLPTSSGVKEKEYSQKLNIKWYDQQEVIRISALADGSCYLHAYLKGFYTDYQDKDSVRARTNIVLNLRRDLAVKLSEYNPEYQHFANDDYYFKLIDNGYKEAEAAKILKQVISKNQIEGYTYWTTVGNGRNIDILTQQIIDPQIIPKLGYDSADIKTMKQDINSTRCLSDLHIINISDMIGVDVIIFRGFEDNLTFHMTTYKVGRERPIVCIVHTSNSQHYELVGILEDSGVKTVFTPNDTFISTLFSLVPTEAYYIDHPNDIFIETIIRNYIDYGKVNKDGSIVIPNILDITELDEDDPYVLELYTIFKYNEEGEIVLKAQDIQKYKEYLRKQGFSI